MKEKDVINRPWKITRDSLGAMLIVDANGEPMAELWPDAPMDLIAAAPNLLAALKAIIEMGNRDDPRIWGQAFDAIAKAEGRS